MNLLPYILLAATLFGLFVCAAFIVPIFTVPESEFDY
jgi:hypothetical protein